MTTELGIIEGFYGPLWQWAERRALVSQLAPAGYRFYLYAPKADAYLRRRWYEPHPPEQAEQLQAFADFCRQQGVRFGVGLSPYQVFNDFDDQARRALLEKLAFFDSLGIEDLAILFDDMSSDLPDLAARQADIVHWVREHTAAGRLTICPSYYSDDPVLDRVFGARPVDYLETLGRLLDPSVGVFWTGEEVCSREISAGHLQRVSDQLGRKPVLWDNYPVNDGDRMSSHLHLRGFSGRPSSIGEHLTAHAINPALQPTLMAIPALTLADSYRQGDRYQYMQSARDAAIRVLGPELGRQIMDDVLTLQDAGLNRLGDEKKASLKTIYEKFDHPGARELLAWLRGDYRVTDEVVQTQ